MASGDIMIKHRNNLRREIEALKQRARGVFTGKGVVPDAMKRPSGPLVSLVPGEQVELAAGSFYRVLAEAEGIWKESRQFHGEYLEALSNSFSPSTDGVEILMELQNVRPDEICYLDLETTGLSNAPLFLVGLMYTSGNRLIIDQLLARDYTEESTVLSFTRDLLHRFSVLVTFNGIRFDIPFLCERMTFTGMELMPPAVHVDLLPLARRVVNRRTPNHKLQTLEIYILNRKRVGDIHGSEIPGVYHEFVRTGDAGGIAGIIHHNRLDLLTMLQLVTVFLSGGR